MRAAVATLALLAAVAAAYPWAGRCVLRRKCEAVACPALECAGGQVRPNASSCGCCPACVKLLDRGDPCFQAVNEEVACSAGLECSEKTRTCVPSIGTIHKPPDSSRHPPCGSSKQTPWNSPPKCSWDGTYAPRQCNAKHCMCVAPNGTVLPYKQLRKHEDKMECVCARVEYAMSQFWSQRHVMCDPFGNYKTTVAAEENP
ncbi:insulin-like growth factor-binding protein 7 [Bacillus rossius redtenbacheri]|uniref:insulin-like growth factor-binding protein 7 n=1 Tax=Bacillus rossius redtenbacheri TaxID=93214 RepID=UPI002FDEADF5